MKSVCIWSYSGPLFPAFGLNTKRYAVSLRIQSKCGKIWTRITPNMDTFYSVIQYSKSFSLISHHLLFPPSFQLWLAWSKRIISNKDFIFCFPTCLLFCIFRSLYSISYKFFSASFGATCVVAPVCSFWDLISSKASFTPEVVGSSSSFTTSTVFCRFRNFIECNRLKWFMESCLWICATNLWSEDNSGFLGRRTLLILSK